MRIGELIKYLECWAPPGVSWEKDNSGLQTGNTEDALKSIFLCLELTPEALSEAILKNCNLIITHHPLIFRPIKNLNFQTDKLSQLIEQLIKNNITLYSSHTSLDFSKGGVSYELAKTLGLSQIKFLENIDGKLLKIIVFVPEENLESVSEAMFSARAGIIGEYSKCSFNTKGTGTFLGSPDSNPQIGIKQNFEKTGEIKLEVLVHQWDLNNVLKSMIKAHPYEEPAYDVISLNNKSSNYGMGAIGLLPEPLSENEFIKLVSEKISVKNLKYTPGNKPEIKSVAVCGGSGSDLLNSAIRCHADAFITADIKYHTFHDAFEKILLIDAGHYETEIFALNALQRYFEEYLIKTDSKIRVHKYSGCTNPVKFYNN